jgi:UDP-3-O-[3-hydroxymyristoyl] glucosamine N-acyltransferase
VSDPGRDARIADAHRSWEMEMARVERTAELQGHRAEFGSEQARGSDRATARACSVGRRWALGILLATCALGSAGPGWAQDLHWARSAVGSSQGNDVASDAAGNVYLLGDYAGDSLSLEGGDAGSGELPAAPSGQEFLAKYDRAGALRWWRLVARGRAVATDAEGNVYVTGSAVGSTTLGEGEDSVVLSADAEGDVLIAKYDGTGRLLWARQSLGGGADGGVALAVDAGGRVHVSGTVSGTASFGEGDATRTVLSAGEARGFLATYDADGVLVWARLLPVVGDAIAVDDAGSSYLGGSFRGSVDFGPGGALISSGGSDAWIAKYDGAGAFAWVRSGGDVPSYAETSSISADGAGNLFVTGKFDYAVVFDRGLPTEVSLRRGGILNPFFARYDSAGTLQDVRTIGGSDDKFAPYDVARDAAGNVYVTGFFLGTIVLGEGEPNETVLSAPSTYPGPMDLFVVQFLPSGALGWARQAHGPEYTDTGRALALDPEHGVYVTGSIAGRVAFGAGEPTETVFDGDGSLFLARYHVRSPGSGDYDNDGSADAADNCPRLENADQADRNGDGFGDACVPPASVDRTTRLGADPLIGPGSRLAPGVVLGARVTLSKSVVLERGVRAGERLQVGSQARIERAVRFGDRVRVGSRVVIERGARIGSDVIIEDGVTLGRDALIENGARIGAGVAIGPCATIGAGAVIARESRRFSGAPLRESVFGQGLILGEGAWIGNPVSFGRDVAIGARSVVTGSTEIGRGSTLGEDVTVEGSAVLGEFVTVTPGATVPFGATIPRGTVFP